MSPPINIDGSRIREATIDGQTVSKITIDGQDAEDFITDSLVSHWTFDSADTSGSTAIDVIGNNDGNINGATTGVSGANDTYTTNEAYSFDGNGDTVDIGPVFDVSAAHSLALWANFDTLNSNDHLFVFEDANNFILAQTNDSGNGGLKINLGKTIVSSSTLTTGSWTHICVTFDPNGDVTLFIEGSSVGSNGYNSDNTGVFGSRGQIGGNNGAGKFEDADIDDVRLYDKALSATEVSNLYNNGSIL